MRNCYIDAGSCLVRFSRVVNENRIGPQKGSSQARARKAPSVETRENDMRRDSLTKWSFEFCVVILRDIGIQVLPRALGAPIRFGLRTGKYGGWYLSLDAAKSGEAWENMRARTNAQRREQSESDRQTISLISQLAPFIARDLTIDPRLATSASAARHLIAIDGRWQRLSVPPGCESLSYQSNLHLDHSAETVWKAIPPNVQTKRDQWFEQRVLSAPWNPPILRAERQKRSAS